MDSTSSSSAQGAALFVSPAGRTRAPCRTQSANVCMRSRVSVKQVAQISGRLVGGVSVSSMAALLRVAIIQPARTMRPASGDPYNRHDSPARSGRALGRGEQDSWRRARDVSFSDTRIRSSVAPGETVRHGELAVSELRRDDRSTDPWDNNPDGPGDKERIRSTPRSPGPTRGSRQATYTGSYITVPATAALDAVESLTLQAWIYPTTPGFGREQGILGRWSSDGKGYCSAPDEQGHLTFRVGGAGAARQVRTAFPLRQGQWVSERRYSRLHRDCAIVERPRQALAPRRRARAR